MQVHPERIGIPGPRCVSRGAQDKSPLLKPLSGTQHQTVQETLRFLGFSSYYRRFINNFAKIAQPLHSLTCKDTPFTWGPDQDCAFEELKKRLTTAPVLAYPNFTAKFCMEADASVQGLGAVLSQLPASPDSLCQSGPQCSRKVVWDHGVGDTGSRLGGSHFHHYLYGNSVTIFADHTAVKAVLESDNPTAKHARWWTRVFGQGIKQITIKYIYWGKRISMPMHSLGLPSSLHL